MIKSPIRQNSLVTSRMYRDVLTWMVCTGLSLAASVSGAVPIVNDPNGFEGIPWGAAFKESEQFAKVEESGRLQSYEMKGTAPALGSTSVDMMRFTTFEGKFGRVTIRYQGQGTHEKILEYLQAKY